MTIVPRLKVRMDKNLVGRAILGIPFAIRMEKVMAIMLVQVKYFIRAYFTLYKHPNMS